MNFNSILLTLTRGTPAVYLQQSFFNAVATYPLVVVNGELTAHILEL